MIAGINIETLKAAYANITRVDPDGEAYRKLCDFLDARSDDELKMLANAKIKWVSSLALNRCTRRGISAWTIDN